MKQIKLIFLLFSFITASSMVGIGIAIAERSMVGIIFSTFLLIIVMGIGFSLKKKLL